MRPATPQMHAEPAAALPETKPWVVAIPVQLSVGTQVVLGPIRHAQLKYCSPRLHLLADVAVGHHRSRVGETRDRDAVRNLVPPTEATKAAVHNAKLR